MNWLFRIGIIVAVGACSDPIDGASSPEDVGGRDTHSAATDGETSDRIIAPPAPCTLDAPAASWPLDIEVADDEPGARYTVACGQIIFATRSGALASVTSNGNVHTWVADDGVRWPASHAGRLVYSAGSPPQVWLLDLASGERQPIAPGSGAQLRPQIQGPHVVWEDERSGHAQIWRWDGVEAGPLAPTEADQRFAAIGNDHHIDVLWTDFRGDSDGRWTGDGSDDADIWGYSSLSGARALVSEPYKQAFPDVDGDTVVWMDWRRIPHVDGHPQPEPKLGHFEIWRGTLRDGRLEDTDAIEGVTNGSYAALPTLGNGWVAFATAETGPMTVRGVRLSDSLQWSAPGESRRPLIVDRYLLRTEVIEGVSRGVVDDLQILTE